jgi:hypothetical protein
MKTRRREMTEAEKEAERARAKQRAYLKAQGMGGSVDASEMQARIRYLHDVHLITFERIASRSGVDLASVRSHYYGKAITRPGQTAPLTTCFWKTHHLIMTTRFGPADVTRVDATGTLRRIQALVADGFPQSWMGERLSRDLAHLNYTLKAKPETIVPEFASEVEQFYRKYAGTNPQDHGVTPRNSAYARTVARKRGWAPSICWDWDTIDDPKAFPEWTGACGTAEGYRVHIRETVFEGNPLPLCDRCRAVVESRPPDWTPTVVLKRDNLIAALKASPKPVKAIARQVLGEGENARDTLYRWRDGSRAPRNMGIAQRLADALDVPIGHIVDEQAMEAEANAPAIGHGEFNPYVLRAAMELGGMSQHKMSMVSGSQASAGAIGKWLKGEMKPSDKSKVKPIARYFGVDVEVFYQ